MAVDGRCNRSDVQVRTRPGAGRSSTFCNPRTADASRVHPRLRRIFAAISASVQFVRCGGNHFPRVTAPGFTGQHLPRRVALRRWRALLAEGTDTYPEMIAQLKQVMSPIAEAAEIQIQVHMDSELPSLEGDAAMLNGVILNLLNNAVKYSPAQSEVTLRVTGAESKVIFEVCNPGLPIPPEDLAHLFEPFYRARATDESTPGWGLGLTFVKRIVEEHRGILEASSDESGIRVRVVLPAISSAGDQNTGYPPNGKKLGLREPANGSE